MEIETQNEIQIHHTQRLRNKLPNKNLNLISTEDTQIIKSLNQVKNDLMYAYKSFDLATDCALIDSFIFEILSLNKKYEYYIKLCKEKGLVAGGF